MAIISKCACGREFGHSASDGRYQCTDCDGTKMREQREEARWAALSTDEKVNELRTLVKLIAARQDWDGRIG